MNSAAQGYPVESEQIFHDFRERVLGYIQSRISSPQDAEDLLSCVFLKVHERLDTYDF